MDLAELLTVETSVLRTLCLSANSETPELENIILGELVQDDFYFPITRSIFAAVSAMSGDDTSVDAENLLRALSRRSVDVPDDFFLEDLFTGSEPSQETLNQWLRGVKNGEQQEQPVVEVAPPTKPTLADTHRSVKVTFPPPPPPPPPPEPDAEATPAATADPEPTPVAAPPKLRRTAASLMKPMSSFDAPPESPPRADGDILSPESGEWLGYLAEMTKKQGERLKTGFSSFDKHWGGLAPGLFLLAGEETPRLLDFLKQLVDQIANRCRVPCLYLSFERSKSELRLQTLSRLSRAPSEHIQGGKFTKDSEEWQNIIRAGEQAVEWLQRIYVVEAPPGIAVSRVRDLRQTLIGSGAGASGLIAIDNLEKLASKSDLLQSVAELKELAESLGIVVVGVASTVELVHEKSADMAASFATHDGAAVLEVMTLGAARPKKLRFDYHPETHRFDEQADI